MHGDTYSYRISGAVLAAIGWARSVRPQLLTLSRLEMCIRSLDAEPRFDWVTAQIFSGAIDALSDPTSALVHELRLFAVDVEEAQAAVRWARASVGDDGPLGSPLTEPELLGWRDKAEAAIAALERWTVQLPPRPGQAGALGSMVPATGS